jgi:hypothetical protein
MRTLAAPVVAALVCLIASATTATATAATATDAAAYTAASASAVSPAASAATAAAPTAPLPSTTLPSAPTATLPGTTNGSGSPASSDGTQVSQGSADGGTSQAGPFTSSSCPPRPANCSAGARTAVAATHSVVRLGRRNGGTTLVFRLSRPAVLKITIFRVYPSCKRVGSFTVHARRGVNRIRFRGRFRGRPLAEGGYRLVIRARGFRRDAGAVPIVIVRGKTNRHEVRKARTMSVCTDRVPYLASGGVNPSEGAPSSSGDAGGVLWR